MSAPLKMSRIFTKTIRTKLLRNFGSLAQVQNESKPWLLHSAVCLMRFPIVSQELKPLEQKYENYLRTVEEDKSYLSDFEVDVKQFERKQEMRKKGIGLDESETELFKVVDLQVKWESEEKEFTAASRINDPEIENDMTSVKRKLDRHLVLIVKQVFSEREPKWSFPQMGRQEGQSMREAAEQALETCTGGGITATILGNAPCAYFDYRLPPDHENCGVKVFFYKAIYNSGQVLDTEDVTEYKWVTHDQLKEYLTPRLVDRSKRFLCEL